MQLAYIHGTSCMYKYPATRATYLLFVTVDCQTVTTNFWGDGSFIRCHNPHVNSPDRYSSKCLEISFFVQVAIALLSIAIEIVRFIITGIITVDYVTKHMAMGRSDK